MVRTLNDITYEHPETGEVRNYICYEFVLVIDECTEPDATLTRHGDCTTFHSSTLDVKSVG